MRNFGLKVGMVGTVRFEARIQELVENLPDMAALVELLLIVRRALRVSWLKAWAMQIGPLGPTVRLTARPTQRLFRLVLESHDGRASVPIPKRSTSP